MNWFKAHVMLENYRSGNQIIISKEPTILKSKMKVQVGLLLLLWFSISSCRTWRVLKKVKVTDFAVNFKTTFVSILLTFEHTKCCSQLGWVGISRHLLLRHFKCKFWLCKSWVRILITATLFMSKDKQKCRFSLKIVNYEFSSFRIFQSFIYSWESVAIFMLW